MIKKSETINSPQQSIHFTFKCQNKTKLNLTAKHHEYCSALKYNRLETGGRLFRSMHQSLPFSEIREEKGGEIGDGLGYHEGRVGNQSFSIDDLQIDPLINLN